jgi:uncharacterized membrane protein YGL010W
MDATLTMLFKEYDQFHLHPTNRLTHKVAIPLIVFHVVAMLSWVHVLLLPSRGVDITLAHVGVVAATVWYLRHSVKLGLIMGVFLLLCLPLAAVTPTAVVVAIAVAGWIVQLLGHSVWEKKSPAFLTNLVHALIGPLYFLALITGDWKAPSRVPLPSAAQGSR